MIALHTHKKTIKKITRKQGKLPLIIGSALLLLFGILLVIISTKTQNSNIHAAGNGVTLFMTPSSVDVSPGTTFNVIVSLDTQNQTASAAEIHISFDPTYLKAESILAKTFLPVILEQGIIGTNSASIIVGVEPTKPAKGVDSIASITFTSLKEGETYLSFDSQTQVAIFGRDDNAVDQTTGATIAIIAPTATSTPELTPEPTSTLTPKGTPTLTPEPTLTATPMTTVTPKPTPTITPKPTKRIRPTPTPTTRFRRR